jgi:DNA-binding response OmpR family regulator
MAKTILMVEDSPTELKHMVAVLSSRGYTIVTAADGDEALAKAASTRPDVVLLDVILPKTNGFQVCRQLKHSPATKDIKVLLVTSKTQESDRFWGMKQGADGYLTKPYQADELTNMVERYL